VNHINLIISMKPGTAMLFSVNLLPHRQQIHSVALPTDISICFRKKRQLQQENSRPKKQQDLRWSAASNSPPLPDELV